jgi:subtilisin family serine protease
MRYVCLAALLVASAVPATAQSQTEPPAARKVVRDIGDLPRFSYPVTGDVTRYVDHPEVLALLVTQLKADVTATLANYDIQDRATLAQLHRILRDAAVFENDAAAYEREYAIVRSLQDKPALAAWTGIPDAARFAALKAGPAGSPAYADAFAKDFRGRLDALDWAVAGQTVRDRYRGLATTGPGIQRGAIQEGLQPTIDASGHVDMNGLAGLLATSNNVRDLLPLVDAERAVEAAWIAANDKPKADIWEARKITLPKTAKLTPVVVGIWDSGVDTSLYGSSVWTNRKERPDGKDNDGNGWVDDVHGVAIDVMGRKSSPLLAPLPAELNGELHRLEVANKGLSDNGAGIDSPEAKQTVAMFRAMSAADAKKLFTEFNWYELYAHGTHVTGIAVDGNPAARVVGARTSFDWHSPPRRPTEATARAFAQRHQDIVNYFKAAGVRVVNMSWGVGLKDEYEDELIANGVSPEQAVVEGKRLFQIERQGLYDAIKNAPGILFVVAAGNGNDSADFSGEAPSSFKLPNVLVVAALDQAGEPTNFTTTGSTVAIAASGYQVESFMPGGQRVRWSGTSMASPQVTNAAAKLFAVDPKLTVAQARDILVSTATPGPGGLRQLDTRAAVLKADPALR